VRLDMTRMVNQRGKESQLCSCLVQRYAQLL
jgi:hypothetical protein